MFGVNAGGNQAGGRSLAALRSTVAIPRPSQLGMLWIDPTNVATYPVVLDTTGRHYLNVTVPLTVPVASAWTLQGVVLTSNGLELTLPATFCLRN
ncbi:MAG: hypothetical protein ACI8UD_003282 [Planctomycetota bacterium]|jgi:hypothetical protein